MSEAKEKAVEVPHLSVKQMDEQERPREKMIARGAEALSNAELFAILIGSGSPKESAVALMQRILSDNEGSLRLLGRQSLKELCHYNGIGEAKALTIMAACELGRRRAEEPPTARPRMDSADKIYNFYRARMEDLSHEEFHVMLLNQNLVLLGDRTVGKGGLTATSADVRLIMHEALLSKATAIVVSHNHPSGNPRPSAADDRLTDQIANAARLLDIRLIDHVIVGEACYYSYMEEHRL